MELNTHWVLFSFPPLPSFDSSCNFVNTSLSVPLKSVECKGSAQISEVFYELNARIRIHTFDLWSEEMLIATVWWGNTESYRVRHQTFEMFRKRFEVKIKYWNGPLVSSDDWKRQIHDIYRWEPTSGKKKKIIKKIT